MLNRFWSFLQPLRSRFPSFDPPSPPLFGLVRFRAPPSPKVHSFWLKLTLNFYTCEIQRQEINNEHQYLWLNSACLLRSHSGIFIKWTPQHVSALWKCLFFIEIPSNNQKSSEVNMKFTICHDFPSPDLLEEPKDGKIKENAKFFSF